MGVKETRNHDENTIFLQLQLSVLLSYTHYYFGYSMLSVCYVCALLVIELDRARVLVMDSKRKPLETFGDMIDTLQW
jgi:hypothetical protein